MRRAALLCLMLVIAAPAAADDLIGQASVIDGDTIEIQGKRIRLFGIDAPESAQTCLDDLEKPYRCGQNAANELADFIGSKTVQCRSRGTDRFGRTVGICMAGSVDLASFMVKGGFAIDWPLFSKGRYAPDQIEARSRTAGIWRGLFVEPSQYRACVRTGGRPDACSTGAR